METLEKLLESKPLSPAEAIVKLNPKYVAALGLRKLERDERVVFRVIQKPIVASDTSGQKKDIYKASQRVPNKCMVYDGDSMHEVAYPEEIVFYRESGSEIVITGKEPNKFPLLWFMRMSNHNQSNTFGVAGSEYIFEEIAELTLSQDAFDKESEIAERITFIKSKSEADVSQICKQLNINGGTTELDKKMALIGYVKNDVNRQKFNALVINALGSIEELVTKSMEYDLLGLDDETKVWSSRIDGNNISEIVQVPIGEDPKKFLVKHFVSDARGKKVKAYFEAKTKAITEERKATQLGKGI